MKRIITLFFFSIVLQTILLAQAHVKYKQELRQIDSVVTAGDGRSALPLVRELYPVYRELDSTSAIFKKLSTNYLFILENSNFNKKTLELANEILSRNLGVEVDGHVYVTLALVHEKNAIPDLTRRYLTIAKPLCYQSQNDSLIAVWNIRESSYHRIYNDKDSARFFADEAYRISREIGNKSTLGTALFLQAALLDDTDDRIEKFSEAVEVFLELNDIRMASSQMLNLRIELLKKRDTARANELLFIANDSLKDKKHLDDSKYVLYLDFREYYIHAKDYKKALESADSFIAVYGRLNEMKNRVEVLSDDFNFKTLRLEKEIRAKELKTLLEREQKENLVFVISIILIILFLMLYIAYDQRKKKRLARKNRLKIEAQNIELVKANTENKLLVKEMNHRLKNNLSTLSALLEIQAQKSTDKTVKAELDKSISRIDLLSEVYKKILDSEENSKVEVSSIIKELVFAQHSIFDLDKESTELNLDQIELKAKETTALIFILNELITNSFKYGERDKMPFVKLEVRKQVNGIIVVVENIGIGIPETYQISDSSTSGLYIVDLLIKQLGGVLRWKSENGSFKFYFQFSIAND